MIDLLKENVEFFKNPTKVDRVSNPFIKNYASYNQIIFFVKFWKLVSKEQLPHLRICTKNVLHVGYTYICESAFSIMLQIKINTQNRMADQTLDVFSMQIQQTSSFTIEYFHFQVAKFFLN